VAAAGNSSTDNDQTPHYPSSYNLGNVVSVAALNRHDQLTSFSNYGARSVHIAAPGEEILSTWLEHGFAEKQGTSMATPFVAGVAALVLAQNPKMSVDDLRALLLKSVDPIPSLRGKVSSGGRINAGKAVGAE
jgi:subtilisin family serine protease